MLSVAEQRTKKLKKKRTYQDIAPYLYIQDKRDELVPLTLNRIQRHFAANRTRRDLVLKSRQIGMTTYCRADDFVFSQIQPSRQLVIADKADNTQKLRRMNDRFYDNLPAGYQIGRKIANASTSTYSNGSEVSIDTAGSSSAGRASTFTRLHASEVAFWKNASTTMSGILNTLPLWGHAVAESTPNGAIGWFFDECMAALDGNSNWKLHFYEWWWHDENVLSIDDMHLYELDIDEMTRPLNVEEKELVAKHNLSMDQIYWRRYKIKEDPILFKQEHPEDVRECFLASGNSYFGDVEHVFTVELGTEYNPDHEYVAGLDFGQDNDFTVLIILDMTTRQVVYMLRVNRIRWEDMRQRIYQACKAWHVKTLLAEYNSIGNVNIEALQFLFDDIDTVVKSFITTAKTKPMLIQALYAALHEHDLRLLNLSEIKHEFRNFISKQTQALNWQYEAAEGGHDDIVIAVALSWFAGMHMNRTIEAV